MSCVDHGVIHHTVQASKQERGVSQWKEVHSQRSTAPRWTGYVLERCPSQSPSQAPMLEDAGGGSGSNIQQEDRPRQCLCQCLGLGRGGAWAVSCVVQRTTWTTIQQPFPLSDTRDGQLINHGPLAYRQVCVHDSAFGHDFLARNSFLTWYLCPAFCLSLLLIPSDLVSASDSQSLFLLLYLTTACPSLVATSKSLLSLILVHLLRTAC